MHNPAAGKQSWWAGVPPALLQHPAAVRSLGTGTASLQLLLLLETWESSRGWDKLGGLPPYIPSRNIKAADDFSWANSFQPMVATLRLPVGVAKADRAVC